MYEELMRDTRLEEEVRPAPPAPGNPLLLWGAVGVTMTVIAGLWFMLLPSQLRRPQDVEPSTWSAARVGQEDRGSDLMEAIRMHGERIEALGQTIRAEARTAAEVEELRRKIEDAGARNAAEKNSTATEDANANLNAR